MIPRGMIALAMISSSSAWTSDYSIEPSKYDHITPTVSTRLPLDRPSTSEKDIEARVLNAYPFLKQYYSRGISPSVRWNLIKEGLLEELHNQYLNDFLVTLDTIVKQSQLQDYLGMLQLDRYSQAANSPLNRAHRNAYNHAIFEIDWHIPTNLLLTDLNTFDYIRLGGIAAKTSPFPWGSQAIDGLTLLKNKNILRDEDEIPILGDENTDTYRDPAIKDFLNEYTSKELLAFVNQSIKIIFDNEETYLGMKYRLLKLIKESSDNVEALKTLYLLAFLKPRMTWVAYHEEPDIKFHSLNYLNRQTTAADWLLGRATWFWQKKFKKEGSIKKALPLTKARELYNKVKSINSLQNIVRKEFPKASDTDIEKWIDTYLQNDDYTNKNIIEKIEQEEREKELEEEQEAEATTIFEHFITQSYTFIKRIFSLA